MRNAIKQSLRRETAERLVGLACGETPPEQVATWALSTMGGNSVELRDADLWRALDRLGGADLTSGPGEYLHTREDFAGWLREFEGSGRPHDTK